MPVRLCKRAGARENKPCVFCSTCKQWKSAAEGRPVPFGAVHCQAEHTLDHMLQDVVWDSRLEEHQEVLDRNRRLGHRRRRGEVALCGRHSKALCAPEGDRGSLLGPETALAASTKLVAAGRLVVVDSR